MRKRIFDVIEPGNKSGKYCKLYDVGMIIIITISLIPLVFKQETLLLYALEKFTMVVFIIDYALRWMTADYFFGKKTFGSFLKYPFTAMAIIDLLSILPSICMLNQSVKVLRVFRMIRAMRVLRVLKTIRYSKSLSLISRVIANSKESLSAVCVLAAGYILTSALIIFNVEPETFETFFDALYWATVSLTTVGYGDIYPVSNLGRVITMASSVFGIAIVALPAGIITAGYMNELQKKKDNNQ